MDTVSIVDRLIQSNQRPFVTLARTDQALDGAGLWKDLCDFFVLIEI